MPVAPDVPSTRLDACVSRDVLLGRIDALARTHALVGPVARCEPDGGARRYQYETVERADQLALDFDYCTNSPKAFVLPPRETLLRFERVDGCLRAVPVFDGCATAIVGVHPCDLHAIRLLDAVFRQDVPDEHYAARRRTLFLVGIDCPAPCDASAFCADVRANDADAGFDAMLYPLGGDPVERATPPADARGACVEYGVVFGSDAGRAWLSAAHGAGLRPAGDGDLRRMADYLECKRRSFPRRLNVSREEIAPLLSRSYDSLVWEATGQRCYSCGSCNLVCPTCYCFDIRDECDLAGERGLRERTWDACMLRDFALVAGDHNFRPRPGQRLRHRLFRKGAWIERRSGLPGCTGCGRCERACTARISMVEILNQLADESRRDPHGAACDLQSDRGSDRA